MPHREVAKPHRARARTLRKNQTDAESRLWGELRGNRLCGHGFRRQVPIGPYIADFVCFSKKLIVEIDGEQHGFDSNQRDDLKRTEWLEGEGFRVIRFWNNEVLKETDAVCNAILDALGGPLEMKPPPEIG
ncbi:MAG: endonuclease domain-containing protein [Propylenella sp.]